MAYSRAIVQRAEARLQSEKEQNERSSRARIAAIYEKEPRLGEIERELRRTAAHVLAATFRRQGDPVAAMQQLKKENLALQQERDWILQAEGLEPDDLTVQPICPTCGGTGYVGAAMCECLKELCRQEQKKELTNLFGAESFEKFRLDLYSDQYDAKYRSSPRELMRATYRMAQNYAQSFPADGQSLVFSGATGLGKTFLSACVARVVAERGFSVSYAPVGQLFAAFEEDKFRPQPDAGGTMLTYHKTTEEEKYRITAWKYDVDYAVYNSTPYAQQKQTGFGFANPKNHFYSFYDGADLVGFINLYEEPTEVFFGIGAAPEHCGKGYGQQMTRIACSICRSLFPGKPMYLEVRTWNRRAVRCYEKAGFRIAGEPIRQTTSAGDGIFYHMVKDA